MKKATELRAWLLAKVPHLKKHPDKLHVLIEKGNIAARQSSTLSFQYRYNVTLIVLDFSEHADQLMIPLLAWIATNQPDLMHHPDKVDQAIQFEAEQLDNKCADIQLTIAITESVVVTRSGTGYQADHLPEPALPDLGGPTNWQMIGNGEEVEQTPLP